MPDNVNFWLTLQIRIMRIWFDMLKCPRIWFVIWFWSNTLPRRWYFTQIPCWTLPRMGGLIWSGSLKFSIILGWSFSHRCMTIDLLDLPPFRPTTSSNTKNIEYFVIMFYIITFRILFFFFSLYCKLGLNLYTVRWTLIYQMNLSQWATVHLCFRKAQPKRCRP